MRTEFNPTQKALAIQRLTALWAFAESGLGGMLHGFHIPVTGLVLGSISVVCISMIASFSGSKTVNILKSLLIVLIVKAVVSPQTPFPAYIAVGFQGLLGFCLFSVARLNFISILLVAVLSMLESALQKILLVTIFFGKSLWTGVDEVVEFIARPLGWQTGSASLLIISCYLFVYLAGGILTTIVAYKLVKQSFVVDGQLVYEGMNSEKSKPGKRKTKKWVLIVIGLLILLFSGLYSGRGVDIIRPLVWTIAVITGWYFIIVPQVTGVLQKILMRSGNKYQAEALEIISFFPFIKQIAGRAWRETAGKTPGTRIPAFVILLVTLLLSFQSPQLRDQQ
jgi:hypothetical protein